MARGATMTWRLALAACGALCGCDAATARDADDARRRDVGAGGELPVAIECAFHFRQSNEVMPGEDPDDPKFQFEERVLRVAAGEDASVTLGDLTLALAYAVPEEDVPAVSISATAGDARLVGWLYQLDGAVRNEFAGDHGFTGLVYLTHPTEGGDYQLICKAR
jgi:hypothetical protein